MWAVGHREEGNTSVRGKWVVRKELPVDTPSGTRFESHRPLVLVILDRKLKFPEGQVLYSLIRFMS